MNQGKATQWIPYIWVAIAMLPILLLRDFTPANELRYLSIADEAIANGNLFAFTNHGIPYADKPPLYIWIVMIGKLLFGRHIMIWTGMFSLIPAIITAKVMGDWSREAMKEDYRIEAALMLLTCGLFAGMTIFLRMDMLMTMFIVLSLRSFSLMHKEYKLTGKMSKGQRWLFPVWVFLAVFSKGPMGILIPLFSTTVFLTVKGEIRQWGRYWGRITWGVLLAGCLVWFGAVYMEGGEPYLNNLLVKQTMGRAVNSFHHKRPFWYYFKTMPYTLAPWTFLLLGVLVYVVIKWVREKSLTNELEQFYVCIVLTTIVLLSCISSKIDVYMLPAYPFIVYLAAIEVSKYSWTRLTALSISLPAILVGTVVTAGLVYDAAVGIEYIAEVRTLVWISGLILAAGCILTAYLLYSRHRNFRKAIRAFAATLLVVIFIGSFAIPNFNNDLGYKGVAEKADEIARSHSLTRCYAWKMNRAENMDVYLSTSLRCMENEALPSDAQKDSTEIIEDIARNGGVIMSRIDRRPPVAEREQVYKIGSKYLVIYQSPKENASNNE